MFIEEMNEANGSNDREGPGGLSKTPDNVKTWKDRNSSIRAARSGPRTSICPGAVFSGECAPEAGEHGVVVGEGDCQDEKSVYATQYQEPNRK